MSCLGVVTSEMERAALFAVVTQDVPAEAPVWILMIFVELMKRRTAH